ncbi:MAG: GNAT family N-acetyltransferase [Acidimicrobiales bacterium]
MREEHRVGLDYLEAVTTLLQRTRNAHPTKDMYEAAELQWWWSIARSTDNLPQLFWFDEQGRPAAAVIAADFGSQGSQLYQSTTVVVSVMPDAAPDWIAHVVDRGLAHFTECGIEGFELEVDRADEVMREVLFSHGFDVKEDGLILAWLTADARPEDSPLHEEYRLFPRSETTHLPHHMINPRRPNVEERLQQTSLYRPDLDLVVLDRDDNPASYGLFWYDPVTATGVVEPMRTHEDHQQRGLARHVLTSGINLLAEAGAERISIGWEPGNPASGPLYLSVGFEPHRQTDLFARGASTPNS